MAGEAEAAMQVYRAALGDDPACHPVSENLGILQMNLGRWTDAEKTFVEALQQPEPLPNHLLNLASVYHFGLNRREDAVRFYRDYLALVPGGIGNIPPELRREVRQ